jgi:Ni,Fe-hydrogenase III component G
MEPVQASITESIDTPGEDMTMTETVTEGQPTVEMPYEQFRAAIPAEVNDEIVQLIYYNQDAFADFAQISTQADVYAFNNKYGVSLVLPMDTETT